MIAHVSHDNILLKYARACLYLHANGDTDECVAQVLVEDQMDPLVCKWDSEFDKNNLARPECTNATTMIELGYKSLGA